MIISIKVVFDKIYHLFIIKTLNKLGRAGTFQPDKGHR